MYLIDEKKLNCVHGGQITLECAINLTVLTVTSIVATLAVGTAGGVIGSTISYATSDHRYTFGGMIMGGAIGCLIPFAVVYVLV